MARWGGGAVDKVEINVNFFQAMFSTDLIESKQERVAINGVEPQMIGMLVSYAYTSEVYISRANVQVRHPLVFFLPFFFFLRCE